MTALNAASARRLPAFAADLASARKRGLTLRNPLVSVALHWRSRPGVGYGVCVPNDILPSALDWTWVRDLDVIVFRDGDAADRLTSAVQAIEACEPRRLVVVDIVEPITIINFVVPATRDARG